MSLFKYMNRVGALAVIAIALIFVSVFNSPVNAQEEANAVTLGISPPLVELTANPGEKFTTTFRLTNASEQTVDIKAVPKNFTPKGEEGAVDLTEERTTYSLSEWISVAPTGAKIGGSKIQDFVVTIDVPSDVEPGSHFGSVVFQTVPPESDTAAALISQEIAPVILIRVAGDVVESAEIEEFKTVGTKDGVEVSKSTWSNEPEITFVSRIKNTGNVHFKPTGQIVIKNMFGKEVAKLDLAKKNVLPDSIRSIESVWQLDGFKVGRYTAELTVVYGDNNEIRTSSVSFTIFPYQTIIPAAILLAIVVWVLIKFRKRLVLAAKVLSGKDARK